jgi:hypothetical protein
MICPLDGFILTLLKDDISTAECTYSRISGEGEWETGKGLEEKDVPRSKVQCQNKDIWLKS